MRGQVVERTGSARRLRLWGAAGDAPKASTSDGASCKPQICSVLRPSLCGRISLPRSRIAEPPSVMAGCILRRLRSVIGKTQLLPYGSRTCKYLPTDISFPLATRLQQEWGGFGWKKVHTEAKRFRCPTAPQPQPCGNKASGTVQCHGAPELPRRWLLFMRKNW
jgi:hypothetical protein